MTYIAYRATRKGRPFALPLILAMMILSPGMARAQRMVSAHVESQTVASGKKTAVAKDIYCRNDGSMTAHYKSLTSEVYMLSNRFGITRIYTPATNEAMTDTQGIFAPEDELLYLFTTGASGDLGLMNFGFRLKDTRKDGDYLIRNYVATKSGSKCERVEIAYRDYLPVYAAYYDKKDKVITKTYYSQYGRTGSFAFPMRVTEITYGKEKNDSTVRLDIYSNLKIDVDDPMFHYDIPADAKMVETGKKSK